MAGVPLHPMIVHFPMVLVILLPVFVLGALWTLRRGAPRVRTWSLPLAFAAALFASAFLAVNTGDREEDRVEAVVAEQALHAHEEAGERFLWLSGALLVIVAAGLVPGSVGRGARLAAAAGAVALVFAGVQVGKAGGELVYVHGAASAYADGGAAASHALEDDD